MTRPESLLVDIELVTAPEHDTLVDDADPVESHRRRALWRLGQRLDDRYELRALLGSGSWGAVYRAHDLREGVDVAVKLLHEGLRGHGQLVARFLREARAAARIGHSSIVTVLDAGRDPAGGFYQVLELLEGRTLFEALEERPLDPADVVELGKQLLGGLAAAHARGIVHRDIKPENLFLMHEPSGALRVKILDFGIAKLTRDDASASFSTLQGVLLGTPHYMSPELFLGAAADEHADLWAAAAVLFHCVTGRPPFDAPGFGELVRRITNTRAPRLTELRPDLPLGLTATIDRGLEPDRSRRFPTARQFADALSIGGAPVSELDWDEDA
ncbi:MAG: serine/threonine protein kinase [Myxococcota bacterium]|nr:serine/threonine protein kinase [Myxococcota bacterium]MDW8363761.1 serine/threonine-protein kinase [Myxococcales bacterium]